MGASTGKLDQMVMVYNRYGLRALNCFLLLVLHLFLSSFHHGTVAAMDVSSSIPPDKEQLPIMMNLSSVVGHSWSSNRNMCSWHGVACSRSRSRSSMVVTGITLSNYGISHPSIFASLCLLDTLLSLDLSRNSIASLGDKFSTTSCRMKESLLSLNMSDNQFSHRLGDFSGFSRLEVLDLSFNHFTSDNLGADLSSFPQLRTLNLSSNWLNGTVPVIPSLRTIDLSQNSLSGVIPDDISEMQVLCTLDLHGNNINGTIPDSISSMSLTELNLGYNALTGSIPKMPMTLSTYLNLTHNHLSGYIPSDLDYLSELVTLDLSYNDLSGEVPSSLRSLQNLTQLVLSHNNLRGSVPNFRQTVEIDIDGNPDLVNHTRHRNKTRAHVDITWFAVLGACAVAGLCLFVVIAMISSPNRTYHEDNENIPNWENDSQITDDRLITVNCFCTSAVMFMKEKQDEWRITAFQTLNFEAADILQGLTRDNLVGSGGSGHVYRIAYTDRYSGSTGVVAVKQILSFGCLDENLEREFESEASILCNIRHNNIVKLLCCLSRTDSKLLVYDYMDNGSLDRWLHGDYVLRAVHPMARARPVQRVPLDWPTRLIVAVGAAQGLCYMHHDCSPPIIHRDVKTSNILLDSEFRAKVADFGLAKMLVQAGEPNTVSWVVGSFGYIAPEYAYTRKVNEKVDVFGFGVVLLELTTDKEANDGGDHGSLAEWARHHYRSRATTPDATDICIRYAGYADEIETVFRLGVKCTVNSPSSRPTMKDVLHILLRCSEQTLRKSRLECSTE